MTDQSKWSLENAASLAGVVSSLGVATFLIVIIGRLWTTTYFEHFGLPSSGLEFNVYDYAFRSLEALISLALGAIAFSAAWLNRDRLRSRGAYFVALELIVVAPLLLWVFLILPRLPQAWDVPTGVLGLSAGLPLGAMIWFALDVFEGPGDPTRSRLASRTPIRLGWKVAGVVFLLAVGFGYLPMVSEKLATMEARADLATRSLPSAVLEAEGKLPAEIASDADPTRSIVVRVVLAQPDNTYVLHSTQCTTIGQLRVPTRVEHGEEFVPPEGPDVCKVFAIPTARLKSVEYVQVGKAAANESRARALEVGLDEEFSESVSTKGASDEDDEEREHRLCPGEKTRFYNSVWYAFEPSTDGAVFARAETPDFRPVMGVWEEPDPAGALTPVTGSGESTGLACETDVRFTRPSWVVGTIATVQGGTRYVAAVASQDEDKSGDVRVSFGFYPGADFFAPAGDDEQATSPEPISQVLGLAVGPGQPLTQLTTATLKLWYFDRERYELGSPSIQLQEATLVTTEDTEYTLTRVSEDEEAPPAHFEATLCGLQEKKPCAEPSHVEIEVEPAFVGLGRLSMSVEPAVVFSLEGTDQSPLRDIRAQAALLLALQESAIRKSLGYGGQVIFDPECYQPEARTLAVTALDRSRGDRNRAVGSLLEEAAFVEGSAIQIQVEGQERVLTDAAEIILARLLAVGLDPSIEPCAGACIRVYFGTPEE